eukprot:COSAG02_NODE_62478_length_265_cov_64.343373_1_plen_58_part_01
MAYGERVRVSVSGLIGIAAVLVVRSSSSSSSSSSRSSSLQSSTGVLSPCGERVRTVL